MDHKLLEKEVIPSPVFVQVPNQDILVEVDTRFRSAVLLNQFEHVLGRNHAVGNMASLFVARHGLDPFLAVMHVLIDKLVHFYERDLLLLNYDLACAMVLVNDPIFLFLHQVADPNDASSRDGYLDSMLLRYLGNLDQSQISLDNVGKGAPFGTFISEPVHGVTSVRNLLI